MSSSSSPIELMILTVELWDSYAQDQVRHCVRPSEGLSACLYVHHAASHGFRDVEKAWRQLHKNAASNIEQVLETVSHKAAAIWPLTTHDENY